MKIIDCEFHYYLPELMDYLATRDEAMRYYPETKVLEVRDHVYAHFGGVTNTYPFIDEMMNFGEERVAEMDRNGIDVGVMSSCCGRTHQEIPWPLHGYCHFADAIRR